MSHKSDVSFATSMNILEGWINSLFREVDL